MTIQTTRDRLTHERARALAVVRLTRDPGVIVRDADEDFGLDLVAERNARLESWPRLLGVVVLGGFHGPSNDTLAEGVIAARGPRNLFGPIAGFHINVKDDQCWYSWIIEPRVDDGGHGSLHTRDEARWSPLTDADLATMWEEVDRWYDVSQQASTTVSSSRASDLAPTQARERRVS